MRHEVSVVVNRSVEEVWAFTTDMFSVLRLGGFALGVRLAPPGPPGLGSTYQLRAVILGFETRISGAITEWDPPHHATISMTGAGIQSGFLRQTLRVTANGTKGVNVVEIVPRPAFKPLWWIAWPFLKRVWNARARNLKRLLEAGQVSVRVRARE